MGEAEPEREGLLRKGISDGMTDRLKGVLVTFEEDVREDDAKHIINAIKMIRRVLTVKPVPSNIDQSIAEDRVRQEIHKKLFKMVYPDLSKALSGDE